MRSLFILVASVGAVDLCTEREAGHLLTNVLLTATSLDPDDFGSLPLFIAEVARRVLVIDSPCLACASAFVPALVAAGDGCEDDISPPACVHAFNAVSDAMSLCMMGEVGGGPPPLDLCTPRDATRLVTDAFMITLIHDPVDFTTTSAYNAAVEDAILQTEIPCAACAVAYIRNVLAAKATASSGCASDLTSEPCIATMADLTDTFAECAVGVKASGVSSAANLAIIFATLAIPH
jgi:hypothetical protein